MVGQKELLNRIDNYTIDTLPHSMMLIGPKGCGKHHLCDYIADKFNLQKIDISNNLSYESLEYLYSHAIPNLVLINMETANIHDQNLILKFLEEPPKSSFVAIICISDLITIETINNRCTHFKFSEYSDEELSQFIPDNYPNKELILKFTKTPGEVENFINCDVEQLYKYVSVIVEKFEQANVRNVISISNHIAYNSEKNLYPVTPFISIMRDILIDKCRTSDELKYTILYKYINNILNNLSISGINEKNLIEHELIKAMQEIRKVTY